MVLDERRIQRCLFWRHQSNARAILPNYEPPKWIWFECDVFVVTGDGYSIEYEIKLTVSDFKADRRKAWKHRRLAGEYEGRFRPTRFFYVVPRGLIKLVDIPDYAGLVYVEIIGEPPSCHECVVREAPRLSKTKVPEEMIAHMRDSAYSRAWRGRFAFDDYRDRVEREQLAAAGGGGK